MLNRDKFGAATWADARERVRRWVAGRSRGRRIVDALVAVGLAALLLATVGAVGSDGWSLLETFGDLQVHIAAGCAVAALVACLLRYRAVAATALALLLVNVASLGVRVATVPVCPLQTAATGQAVVRIMQHNIWKENHDFAAFRRVVERERPDVIVMQEIQPFHHAWFDRLRTEYPYRAYCDGDRSCAVTMLSRYPLVAGPQVDPENDLVLRAVVSVGTRKLVVLGTYIVTPFPGQGQDWEFGGLTRIMKAQPSSAVLMGDFNSVFWSPNMARYIAASGVCSTNPMRATFPRRFGPVGLPIDHIFLKPGVGLLNVKTIAGTGSDHRALLATVSIH